MGRFVENPVQFAADCACREGRCVIDRDNFLFLDDGDDLAAVDRLQSRCGNVVIAPDPSDRRRALVYHTSCDRMSDVVGQIFLGHLGTPESLPQADPEMSIGALYRRGVAIAYDDCRARVARFPFEEAALE